MPGPKIKCEAITHLGNRCRAYAVIGTDPPRCCYHIGVEKFELSEPDRLARDLRRELFHVKKMPASLERSKEIRALVTQITALTGTKPSEEPGGEKTLDQRLSKWKKDRQS